MKIEPFRFRSENGIFKFFDKFNEKKNSKNILTFVTSIFFLVNINSLKLNFKEFINSIIDRKNSAIIINFLFSFYNVYYTIKSDSSITNLNFREEIKKRKKFIDKIVFIYIRVTSILTFMSSLFLLVNNNSWKLEFKDLIDSVIDRGNSIKIISIILMLSNIYHAINSELSLINMNYKEEIKKRKNIIDKIWFSFNIYEVGYLPYEMVAFLLINRIKVNVVDNRLMYFFILRNIPFYLLSIFKDSQLNKNNNLKDIFEMFHALSGIYIMYKYRINA